MRPLAPVTARTSTPPLPLPPLVATFLGGNCEEEGAPHPRIRTCRESETVPCARVLSSAEHHPTALSKHSLGLNASPLTILRSVINYWPPSNPMDFHHWQGWRGWRREFESYFPLFFFLIDDKDRLDFRSALAWEINNRCDTNSSINDHFYRIGDEHAFTFEIKRTINIYLLENYRRKIRGKESVDRYHRDPSRRSVEKRVIISCRHGCGNSLSEINRAVAGARV